MKMERGYPTYTVTPKAENAIVKGHPWVYDAEILNMEGETANGGLVDVISKKGRYLGTGFLSQQSKIRVRLISRNANDRFDEAFWRRKLQWAWDYRKSVMDPADLDACRVIFGEADAFPGLTVDRFESVLVTQTLSMGMERIKDRLFPLLVKVLREDGQDIRGIYERNDVAIRGLEGMEQNKGWYPLPGETPPERTDVDIVENGITYRCADRTLPGSFPQRAGSSRTASPTPAPSPSMPPRAGRPTSPPWTYRSSRCSARRRMRGATGWTA